MKTYIVRTPEHDRRLLTIPTGANDWSTQATGKGRRTTNIIAENNTEKFISLETSSELSQMTLNSSGQIVTAIAGLFLAIVTVQWDWQTPGDIVRFVGVSVNAATPSVPQEIPLRGTVGDSHTDLHVSLIRLAVGDTVQPWANNFNGGSNTEIMDASLQLVCVAP